MLNLTSLLRQEWGVQTTAPRDVLELIELGDDALAAVRSLLDDRRHHAAHTVAAAQARLLAPIPRPRKNVFRVGRNYREHIIEGNRAAGAATPTTFRRRWSCSPSRGAR